MKAKKIRKQMIAMFIGIALVISQLYGLKYIPVSAEPDPVASISDGSEEQSQLYSSFEDALTDWTSGKTLKLLKDVVIDHPISLAAEVDNSRLYNLDLNNHGIRLDQAASGSVIYIEGINYGSTELAVRIYDTASVKTARYISLDENGRGMAVSETQPSAGTEGIDYIEVTGGYITGGTGSSAGAGIVGGGIYVGANSYLTMESGNIAGNIAGEGGGIFAELARVSLENTIIADNIVESSGGGICSYNSDITLKNCVISGNASDNGGGIYAYNRQNQEVSIVLEKCEIGWNVAPGSGGGIYIVNDDLTIKDTNIENNICENWGGGIYSTSSKITMTGSSCISYNIVLFEDDETIYGYGGGIYSKGSQITISDDSCIVSNIAKIGGGGINVVDSTVIMNDNSSIENNSAESSGGGICARNSSVTMSGSSSISNNIVFSEEDEEFYGYGGGIYSRNSSVSMLDSATICNNISGKCGGGIYTYDGGAVSMIGSADISYNASGEGGGIYAFESDLSMNGYSSINNNFAEDCGGVRARSNEITMQDNASIVENQAMYECSGLYLYNSVLDISGKTTIFDNVLISEEGLTYPGNICFNDSDILVSDHLTGKIGVTCLKEDYLVATAISGVTFSDDDINCFVSDCPDYLIVNNDGSPETVLNKASAWVQLQNSIIDAGKGQNNFTVTLDDDYVLPPNSDPLYIPEEATVILDLNGHTIDRSLSKFGRRENGTVIEVYGNLTLQDNSLEKDGKITGGNAYWGGGIYVDYGATLIMDGGTIEGNRAVNGGGIYASGSNLVMTGDSVVTGNIATEEGGGVSLDNYYGDCLVEVSGKATVYGNNLGDEASTPSNVLFLDDNEPIKVTGALTGRIGISTKKIDENDEYIKKVGIVFAEADTSYNEGELTLCDAKAFVSDYYDYAVGIELQTYLGGLYLGTPITVEEISPMYYTGKELKPAVTVKSGNSELTDKNYGMLFFRNGTEVEQLVTPGKYTVTVIGTGIDAQNNYYGGIVDKEFVINKGKNKLTKEPSALQLTADGNDKALVSEGEAENGTVLYALGTDDISSPKEGFDKNVPKASSAGTYYVWYMVDGDDYYESTVPVCVVVTINRANPENPSGGDEEPENPSGGGGNISNPNNNQGGGNGNNGRNGGTNGGSSNPTSENGGNNGNGNGTGNGSGTPGNVDPLKPQIIKSEKEELENGDTVTTITQQIANIIEEIVTTKDKNGDVKSVITTVKDSKDNFISKTVTEFKKMGDIKKTFTTITHSDKTKEKIYEKVDKNGNTYRSETFYDENNNRIQKTVEKFKQTSNKTKETHSVEDASGAKKIFTTSTYVSGNTIDIIFDRKTNGNGSYSWTKTIKDTGEVIVKNYGMAKNGNFTVKEITPNKNGVVNIPGSVSADGKTHKVISVYKDAFKDNTEVTSVNFGKNIIKIGANAFAGATNLTNLTFKGKVEKIEQGAFDGVETLTIDLSYVKDQKELEAEIERLMGLFEASGAETKLEIISSKLESEKLEE